MKELSEYINEGILGKADEIMDKTEDTIYEDVISNFIISRFSTGSIRLISCVLPEDFKIVKNKKSGLYDIDINAYGQNIVINVDKGYEIPSMLGDIRCNNTSRYFPIFTGNTEALDLSLLDHCWNLGPAKSMNHIVTIDIPERTNNSKHITIHNLNVPKNAGKGKPVFLNIRNSRTSLRSLSAPLPSFSFNHSDLSNVDVLFLDTINLCGTKLENFPGFKVKKFKSKISVQCTDCNIDKQTDPIFYSK